MLEPHTLGIASVIQLSVAPVFMLTAVGMIIAALSVRLGRAVDRRRILEQALGALAGAEARSARAELDQITRRVRCVYFAIVCAVLSALFVCLLIVTAFFGAFVETDLTRLIAAMFVMAMVALIGSLLFFLREIFLAVYTPRHIPSARAAD